jgi:hypothetical protein
VSQGTGYFLGYSQLRGDPVNADVLTTRVADEIAVITLGSARRIYFDEEMGDALTEALDRFARDANVRVVVVTGGGRIDVRPSIASSGPALSALCPAQASR